VLHGQCSSYPFKAQWLLLMPFIFDNKIFCILPTRHIFASYSPRNGVFLKSLNIHGLCNGRVVCLLWDRNSICFVHILLFQRVSLRPCLSYYVCHFILRFIFFCLLYVNICFSFISPPFTIFSHSLYLLFYSPLSVCISFSTYTLPILYLNFPAWNHGGKAPDILNIITIELTT
jgi:hypothetical protein